MMNFGDWLNKRRTWMAGIVLLLLLSVAIWFWGFRETNALGDYILCSRQIPGVGLVRVVACSTSETSWRICYVEAPDGEKMGPVGPIRLIDMDVPVRELTPQIDEVAANVWVVHSPRLGHLWGAFRAERREVKLLFRQEAELLDVSVKASALSGVSKYTWLGL